MIIAEISMPEIRDNILKAVEKREEQKPMADRWPFIPNHISNNKQNDGLKGTGIITNEELAGLQMAISAELGLPTTIMEYYNNKELKTNPSRRYLGCQACLLFRKHTDDKICDKADRKAVSLLKDLVKSGRQQNIPRQNVTAKWPPFPLHQDIPKKTIGMVNNRAYLYYDCPFLGYRENIFPIFFDKKIIAVFIIGQICLEGDKEKVRTIQAHFFKNNRKFFKKDFHQRNDLTLDQWITKIRKENEELWSKKEEEEERDILTERVGILTEENYKELIKEADERLAYLEEQLKERVDHRRERFALATINNEIKSLYQDVPKQINISNPQPLRRLWENVEKRLKTLAKKFSFRYIAMFGKENVLDIADTTLPMVAYANNPQRPEVYKRPTEPMRFETNVLPHKEETESISSDKVLEGLPRNWPWLPGKTSKTITGMACPVPFHWETPLIIVFGHSPGGGPAQFSYLDDALRNFGAVVVSIFSAMLEMLTEQRTIASFRVLGHEINTQTEGLSSLVNTYISDVGSLRNLDEEKAYYIGRDVDSYLDQIHLLFRNARHLIDIIGGAVTLKKNWFYAYGPLVYKWKNFYRYDLEKNGREMPLEKVEPTDESRPKIYGDKSYLEEMLYNLIDNAMKYSYMGTQIYVDCGLCENGRDYFFSVRNYGREMPVGEEGEHLYEIFARAIASEGVEGVGIGLSLTRAIARAHGGTLTHKCNSISSFNIPLIRPYLKYVEDDQRLDKGWPSLKDLKVEEQALRQNDTYSKVVSSQPRYYRNGSKGYYPFWTECRDSINQPTFEVTFTAIIPQKGEKK